VIDTVRHCRERKRLWLGSSAARDVGRPESSSSTRRTEPGGRIKRRPEVGIPDGGPQNGRIRACAESTSDSASKRCSLRLRCYGQGSSWLDLKHANNSSAGPTGRSDIDRLTCPRASAQRLKQTSPKRRSGWRPHSCGKEKWRILPVGEVHDQPAALAGGHRRNAP